MTTQPPEITLDVHDRNTIINAIRKRIPEARVVKITEFLDAVGVGLGASIDGVAVLMTERLPKAPVHKDYLNAIDRFSERIKAWRKHQQGGVHLVKDSPIAQKIFVGDTFGYLSDEQKKKEN